MKKILFVLAIINVAAASAVAQLPFPAMDSINVNHICAPILVHGDMWWNPNTLTENCFFRRNSHPVTINFTSAIWMSGYDAGNRLHVSAQTYRQDGNDYWPGPLDSSDTLTYATSYAWAKIWKVNRSDIQYVQSLTTHTTANTPDMILKWPGKGNTYARGNNGTVLNITTEMAPFVDLNGNGIYEPLLGEYPDIKGDQALWWIFSDNGPSHSSSNGRPAEVEIRAMAYGYNRGTLIDNVVYYDYYITNKSSNNYHNFRFGQWDDAQDGYYIDDFIGFDSTWRMGICYNGTEDDGGSGGHPVNSFGSDPPQTGLTMIVLPGDAPGSYVPAGSFTYYNNDFSVIGTPRADTQYNNYLRGMDAVGQRFSYDFDTAGVPSTGLNPGRVSNYVYTGDPGDPGSWSECACHNDPGDRRFILASADFNLNSGDVQHLVFAQLVADSTGGCPQTSFEKIRIVADTAWGNYYNPPPPKPAGVKNILTENGISVYPNPTQDKLFIETNEPGHYQTVVIFSTLGQEIAAPFSRSATGVVADVSKLPPGLYILRYQDDTRQATMKFFKE